MNIEVLALTPAEVAVMLGVSKAAIYRRVRDGSIPSVHVGRSVRIPKWWVAEQVGAKAA